MAAPTRTSPAAVALDDTAKAIIRTLQRDGRTPYATIAREVGLSEAAVRQRVQRLLDSDLLQIVAVTDPLQVGFTRQAMVGIVTSGDSQKVARELETFDEVVYLITATGRFDLLAEIVCTDDEHLLSLLHERIRGIKGVTGTETFNILKLNKQRYDWGTR
jgi:Lrp/AsnC family transcriptional regulator, regulator for asnA, asnC and gidA